MSNYFKHQFRKKSPAEIAGWVVLAILGFAGLIILFGFIIMWLWNWLMPELFGLTTITYWQGMGLGLLAKILFGGIGGGGGKSGKGGHKNRSHSGASSNKECNDNTKGEISKWKMYDKFWNEEGNQAFEAYVAKQKSGIHEEE
jgi:hypothetical protein